MAELLNSHIDGAAVMDRTPASADTTAVNGRMSAMKKMLMAAIVAMGPALSSCVVESESDTESAPQEIGNVEALSNAGNVDLQFDGTDWYVEGNYGKEFELEVYADDQLVHTEVVPAGQFVTHKPVGFEAGKIKIQAFKMDETGSPIKISSNPGPEGMMGLPVAYNTLKK